MTLEVPLYFWARELTLGAGGLACFLGAMEAAAALFKQLDLDGNGTLDAAEVAAGCAPCPFCSSRRGGRAALLEAAVDRTEGEPVQRGPHARRRHRPLRERRPR